MGMRNQVKCFKALVVFSGSVTLIVLVSLFGPEAVNEALVFRDNEHAASHILSYEDDVTLNLNVSRGGWKRGSTRLMPRALSNEMYNNVINLLEDFHALAKQLNSTPIMNRGMLLGKISTPSLNS